MVYKFSPQDRVLIGDEDAKQEMRQFSDITLFLKETFHVNNGDN